jgi:hypothetical protein
MATLILLPLFLCATNPDKIAANYFFPLNYKNYVEEQIILEMACVGNVQVSFTKELQTRLKGRNGKLVRVCSFFGLQFFT